MRVRKRQQPMMPTALSAGVDDKGTTLDKSGITSEATDLYDQHRVRRVDTDKKEFCAASYPVVNITRTGLRKFCDASMIAINREAGAPVLLPRCGHSIPKYLPSAERNVALEP